MRRSFAPLARVRRAPTLAGMNPGRRPISVVLALVPLAAAACEGAAPSAPSPAEGGLAPSAPADGGAAPKGRADASSPPPDAPAREGDLDPTGPAVQLVGRFDRSDPRGPVCGFPGCRIVTRFSGTSAVTVRLEGAYEPWMEGAPSEWDVVVDGAVIRTVLLTLGEHAIEVDGLDAGVHVVELYKRSEAQTGLGRLLRVDLHGGTLLAPPRRPSRRLEIIGDSQPAAFGVESYGLGPNCPGVNWSGHYQNFRKSFGTLLGARFGAEVFGTVYSGKGMAQNIWSTDAETMPVIYRRANPLDKKSTWSSSSWVPDAIVIMLGGNDFAIGQPFDRGPTTLAAFIDAYRAFAADLRQRYPRTLLVLAVSPSVTDEQPPGRDSRTNVAAGIRAVVKERLAAGDTRVVEVAPPLATPAELVGCNGHGTAAYHVRVAADLAPILAAKLGW